jgi:hypothetical protein
MSVHLFFDLNRKLMFLDLKNSIIQPIIKNNKKRKTLITDAKNPVISVFCFLKNDANQIKRCFSVHSSLATFLIHLL